MSKVQTLRALAMHRPTAAVEELLEELTALEDELSRSKQENARLRKRLLYTFNPEVRLHRIGLPPDNKQQFVQQKWSPSLDQEEPGCPHIKEEQDALSISQEVEQLHALKESVKSEDDEVKVQSFQLHQSQSYENTEAPSSISTQNGNPKIQMRISTQKPHSCLVFGKNLTQNGNLNMHMRIHTGGELHSCSVCGKIFTHTEHLKTHMMIHSGGKPYSCSVCGKDFTDNGVLKRHMIIHTGEKPHSCYVCGKSFVANKDLKRHVKIHTGEKPYSCSVCGKNFSDRGSLKPHMRIHTGEKPHSCSVCGKSFTQKEQMKVHMKIHTRQKLFFFQNVGKDLHDTSFGMTRVKVYRLENIQLLPMPTSQSTFIDYKS